MEGTLRVQQDLDTKLAEVANSLKNMCGAPIPRFLPLESMLSEREKADLLIVKKVIRSGSNKSSKINVE